jgi:hypothetical protein
VLAAVLQSLIAAYEKAVPVVPPSKTRRNVTDLQCLLWAAFRQM